MKKLRWGVIGAGGIAYARTIPAMMKADHAQLTAVMTTTMEKSQKIAGEFGGIRAYDSAEDLIRDPEVDAVYLATPVYLHLPHIRLAAKYGKHVLSEKPLGLNAQEAEEAIRVCQEAGVTLSVGFMMRYGSHIRRMKQAVEEGKLGQLVSGFGQFSCWMPPREGGYWCTTMAQAGGGPIMDMGVHIIDLIHYVTGMKVTHVTAMQERITFTAEDYDVDDTSSVILRLENGAQFVVQTCFNLPDCSAVWRFDLFGTQGRFLGDTVIGQEDGGVLDTLFVPQGYDPFGAPLPSVKSEADFGNLYEKEIEELSLAILEGRQPPISPRTAVEAQKVIDAAYESSRTGRAVCL